MMFVPVSTFPTALFAFQACPSCFLLLDAYTCSTLNRIHHVQGPLFPYTQALLENQAYPGNDGNMADTYAHHPLILVVPFAFPVSTKI